MFSDADAAELYDLLNPWNYERYPADRFYHELVMAADSVLDVGCGTGAMLACAREHGHRGRLAGIDPDHAALDRAKRRAGTGQASSKQADPGHANPRQADTGQADPGHANPGQADTGQADTGQADSMQADSMQADSMQADSERAGIEGADSEGAGIEWGDIEWAEGTAADANWRDEFDLAVMTGHAFQCLVTDDDVRASLAAIHAALRPGGRFAFETRHPQARAWEDWNPANAMDVTGRPLRVWHEVQSVYNDLVTFTETTASPDGSVLRVDQATLRFLDPSTLNALLSDAAFQIEAQYGAWDRTLITTTSREIITIARKAGGH